MFTAREEIGERLFLLGLSGESQKLGGSVYLPTGLKKQQITSGPLAVFSATIGKALRYFQVVQVTNWECRAAPATGSDGELQGPGCPFSLEQDGACCPDDRIALVFKEMQLSHSRYWCCHYLATDFCKIARKEGL